MRAEFPGYFQKSDATIKHMWQEGIFSFDANFLLNGYRYSTETREQVFNTLEAIKSRIWIPHQSAYEFLKNRLEAIADAEKSYDEIQKPIKEVEAILRNSRHPYVDESLLEELKKLSKTICDNLDKRKSEFGDLLNEDQIQKRIADVFAGKIGPETPDAELNKIYSEGEKRFKAKVPPGYKDVAKPDNSKYGDFVLWEQLIKHASQQKKPVIFVTGDAKEDWVTIYKGKTLGPRPELISEMKKRANVDFYLYPPERFLELSKSYLKQKVSSDAIAEVKELRTGINISELGALKFTVSPRSQKALVLFDVLDSIKKEGITIDEVRDAQLALETFRSNLKSTPPLTEEMRKGLNEYFFKHLKPTPPPEEG